MNFLPKWMTVPVLLAAITAAPASGHHSTAMFDETTEMRLESLTITRFEWTNPHVFVIGKIGSTTYAFECGSPNLMSRQGWKHNTLTPGTKIDVVFYPLRNGKPGGMLKTVILPSGKSISGW